MTGVSPTSAKTMNIPQQTGSSLSNVRFDAPRPNSVGPHDPRPTGKAAPQHVEQPTSAPLSSGENASIDLKAAELEMLGIRQEVRTGLEDIAAQLDRIFGGERPSREVKLLGRAFKEEVQAALEEARASIESTGTFDEAALRETVRGAFSELRGSLTETLGFAFENTPGSGAEVAPDALTEVPAETAGPEVKPAAADVAPNSALAGSEAAAGPVVEAPVPYDSTTPGNPGAVRTDELLQQLAQDREVFGPSTPEELVRRTTLSFLERIGEALDRNRERETGLPYLSSLSSSRAQSSVDRLG